MSRQRQVVRRDPVELERVSGEVVPGLTYVEGSTAWPVEPVAYPVGERLQRVIVTYDRPPVEVEPPASSKVVPWALIALALCILAFSIFAALHTVAGPDVKPVRSQQSIDLVGPSR